VAQTGIWTSEPPGLVNIGVDIGFLAGSPTEDADHFYGDAILVVGLLGGIVLVELALTPSDNFVDGLGGNDVMEGNGGNDTLFGSGGDDFLLGGRGQDYLFGGADDDRLRGGGKRDFLDGGSGEDTIVGGGGNDTLDGGNGNDILRGGGGKDLLIGGDGRDKMRGGDGEDTFVLSGPDQPRDVLKDFVHGEDVIAVVGADFGLAAGTDLGATGQFTANAGGLATGALGQFIYDTDDGLLIWDANGTGHGGRTVIATLTGAPTVTASDISVI